MKILAAAFLTLILILGAAEGYFRFARLAPENQDRYFEPYILTGGQIDFEDPNRFGSPEDYDYEKRGLEYYFRFSKPISSVADREFMTKSVRGRSLAIPASAKKIFVVGGSVAYGDGTRVGTEWWRVLEARLRHDLHDELVTVIPAAMPSWVSTQERIALELYVFPKKPRAIVVVNGFNDVFTAEGFVRPGDPFNQGILYARYYSPAFQIARWVSNHSAMARYLLLHRIRRDSEVLLEEIKNDPKRLENKYMSTTSVYLDNIRTMARRCSQEGVPCYFILQPSLAVAKMYENPSAQIVELHRYFYQHVSEFFEANHGILEPESRFYDFSRFFSGNDEKYFFDEVHFSEAGQERFGESVEKLLLSDPAVVSKLVR